MFYINIMLPEVSKSATKMVCLSVLHKSVAYTVQKRDQATECHVEVYKQQRRQETCLTKKFKAWEGSRSWKMREVNLNSVQGASWQGG
jgi:tRNA A-37 threonylcarbamoyl transferase component Bud32